MKRIFDEVCLRVNISIIPFMLLTMRPKLTRSQRRQVARELRARIPTLPHKCYRTHDGIRALVLSLPFEHAGEFEYVNKVAYRNTKSKALRLHRAPGWGLLSLVGWVFHPRTVNRVFLQTITDMQEEHIEALAEGRLWKARWVVLRGRWSFCCALAAQAPLSLARRLYEIWKAAS